MKYTKILSQQVLAWAPTPKKIPVERSLEKVGKLLSNNPSMIVGISLCPNYHKGELRKINRIQKDNKIKKLAEHKKEYKFKSNKSKKSEYTTNRKSKQYYHFLQNEKYNTLDFSELTIFDNGLTKTIARDFIGSDQKWKLK